MAEAKCSLCGDPMPSGEEMFKYHGYSGACPKPLLPKKQNKKEELIKKIVDAVWTSATFDEDENLWLDNIKAVARVRLLLADVELTEH